MLIRSQGFDLINEHAMVNLDKCMEQALTEIICRLSGSIGEQQIINQIINAMISDYDVSPQECREEVLKFLEELNGVDLVKIF